MNANVFLGIFFFFIWDNPYIFRQMYVYEP